MKISRIAHLVFSSFIATFIILPIHAGAQSPDNSSTTSGSRLQSPLLVVPNHAGLGALGEEIEDVDYEIDGVDAELKKINNKIDQHDQNSDQVKKAQNDIADLATAGRALTKEEMAVIKSKKEFLKKVHKEKSALESEKKKLEEKKIQLEKEREGLILEYNRTSKAMTQKEKKDDTPSSPITTSYGIGDKFSIYVGYSYIKIDALTEATQDSVDSVNDGTATYDSDETGNGFMAGFRYKGFDIYSDYKFQPYLGFDYQWIDGIGSEESFNANGLHIMAMRKLEGYGATFIGGFEVPLSENGRWKGNAGIGARYQKNTLDFSASSRDVHTDLYVWEFDLSKSNSGFVPYMEMGMIFDSPKEGQGGWRGEAGIQVFKFEFTDPVQEKDYSDTPASIYMRLSLDF